MTKEHVIQLGKEALNVGPHVFEVMGLTLLFISTIMVCVLLSSKNSKLGFGLLLGTVISTILGGSILLVGSYKNNQLEEAQVEKWKEEMATPYVESLPVEKGEVVFIKIEPELTSEIESPHYYYTRSKLVERTPVTITFKGAKGSTLTTLTSWYETHMELTNEKTPYVTYQYLDSKLGEDFDKGYYNIKIYLPKDYKFTEIK